MNTSLERREVFYSGRVQGVGFRFTTRKIAESFDVTGYVQNLPDGRVKVVAEGTIEEIEPFLSTIESDLGNYITKIQKNTLPADNQESRFEIRF